MATTTDRLGTLERVGDRARLRYERLLRHPRERVWRALTDPEDLRAWFPTGIVGDRATGAALTFPFPDQDLPAMTGEMLRFEPPAVLELRWGPDDILRFELATAADDAGGTGWCALTLVAEFTPLGKAARDGAGWHECLDLLATHLAGGEPWAPGQRWAPIAARYRAAFGPEASELGPPDGWKEPTEPR
ncbi:MULTISPECIES: SRPBCC family protein [Pseudofrankia]|uniref:SRPBCC family protein n=1 Tax=Pseudofrankia TaxID=2994363 RepID=UPI000234CD00|nr:MULTISPECIES: SRPBCC family protein [Pseudofrankia]OHV33380.1 hypothetical protein BCD49_27335 [Pseudofrankia sp. EUN1h]